MIRTCRIFFPTRNNYNVSLFNQRTCQPKQTSMEFSFYTEQWKENYLQKKSCDNVKKKFSTFKQQEDIIDTTQQKKSKSDLSSDYVTFKAQKISEKEKSFSSQPEKKDLDFFSFKESLKSKAMKDAEPVAAFVKPLKAEMQENPDKFQSSFRESVSGSIIRADFPLNAKIDSKEAIKSLQVLAKTGNRATSAINLYGNALLKNNETFTLVESCNIMFSFAKLTYASKPVLDHISTHILEELPKTEAPMPRVLVSLLQSVCKLRYRNCELIENLCIHLEKILTKLSVEQTTLCLFALTNIYFQTSHVENFIKVLSNLKNTDFISTRSFLNYVWASVILDKQDFLSMQHLETVLSKAFMEQLTISGDNNLLNKIKLSNISGVASGLKNYKGPLQNNLILSPVLSRTKNDFLSTIRDTLSYLFPKTGFMEALSYAGSGVFIDIECALDQSLSPVPLKNKEKFTKIAILLMDHNDYCLESTDLTGVNAFKIARIQSNGYKIIIVPQAEFPFGKPLSTKIAFFREKFKHMHELQGNKKS